MIINNLLLKLKGTDGIHIDKAREVLLDMRGRIPHLKDLQVRTDIRKGEASYDLMMIAVFDSMEDFDAYLVHPAHVKAAKYIMGVMENIAAVCYEADGMPTMTAGASPVQG